MGSIDLPFVFFMFIVNRFFLYSGGGVHPVSKYNKKCGWAAKHSSRHKFKKSRHFIKTVYTDRFSRLYSTKLSDGFLILQRGHEISTFLLKKARYASRAQPHSWNGVHGKEMIPRNKIFYVTNKKRIYSKRVHQKMAILWFFQVLSSFLIFTKITGVFYARNRLRALPDLEKESCSWFNEETCVKWRSQGRDDRL